mgnify:CR=1 FL=1
MRRLYAGDNAKQVAAKLNLDQFLARMVGGRGDINRPDGVLRGVFLSRPEISLLVSAGSKFSQAAKATSISHCDGFKCFVSFV